MAVTLECSTMTKGLRRRGCSSVHEGHGRADRKGCCCLCCPCGLISCFIIAFRRLLHIRRILHGALKLDSPAMGLSALTTGGAIKQILHLEAARVGRGGGRRDGQRHVGGLELMILVVVIIALFHALIARRLSCSTKTKERVSETLLSRTRWRQ